MSRTLGLFSVNSHLYMSRYSDHKTLEITGYLGEVILGFMRCRGELDYSLGDKRLLARLGGCYLHNSVDELKDIFHDQEIIINNNIIFVTLIFFDSLLKTHEIYFSILMHSERIIYTAPFSYSLSEVLLILKLSGLP